MAAPARASQSAPLSVSRNQRRFTPAVGPSKSKSRSGLNSSQRYPAATPSSTLSDSARAQLERRRQRAEVAPFAGRIAFRRPALERLVVDADGASQVRSPSVARHISDDCAIATFSLRAAGASKIFAAPVADQASAWRGAT